MAPLLKEIMTNPVLEGAKVKLRYVGLKPTEIDHLYGTGLVWVGNGDIKEVPVIAWNKGMKNHPDVWALVETETCSISPYDETTGVHGLTEDEVRELGKQNGLHHRLTTENMRAKLVELGVIHETHSGSNEEQATGTDAVKKE